MTAEDRRTRRLRELREKVQTVLVPSEWKRALEWRDKFLNEDVADLDQQTVCYLIADAFTLREVSDLLDVAVLDTEGDRLPPQLADLASAMRKMLPPDLLQQVILHLDPLEAFVQFLHTQQSFSVGDTVEVLNPSKRDEVRGAGVIQRITESPGGTTLYWVEGFPMARVADVLRLVIKVAPHV